MMAIRLERLDVLDHLIPTAPEKRSWRYRLLTVLLCLPTDRQVEQAAAERAAQREAEKLLPERVLPDDPERLAFEAEMRAIGVRPAKVWNFPMRKPHRKPDWRDWLRYHLG